MFYEISLLNIISYLDTHNVVFTYKRKAGCSEDSFDLSFLSLEVLLEGILKYDISYFSLDVLLEGILL